MFRSSPTRMFLVGLFGAATLLMALLVAPGVADGVAREISRKTDEVSYQIMGSFPKY